MQDTAPYTDYGGMNAAESAALQVRWNSERLDGLLAGIATLRPIARSGFETLDSMLSGGFGCGCHIISATPGAGKTSLCCQLADHFARFSDRRVLYFSCEMSASSLLLKSLTRLSGELSDAPLSFIEILNLSRILNEADNPRVDLLMRTIDLYRESISGNLATIDSGVSLDAIASTLDSASKQDAAPIAFVDYVQLLKSGDNAQVTDYAALTSVVRRLCELARDYRTAVICISSQNRTNSRGSSDFKSLSGTSELEYGASSISFLTYEEGEQLKPNIRSMRLSLAKSRYGRTGNVDLWFYPASSRFVECETR